MKFWRHLLLVLAVSLGVGGVAVANDLHSESEVKAAVIFNVLLFVEWPAAARSGDIHLCLVDGGALGAALRKLEGKTIHGRRLHALQIGAAPEELRACHIVVVEGGNPAALVRVGVAAKALPLLVLGDGASSLDRGAMIAVYTEGARVAFDIDLAALRRAQLVASSKLLRLARRLVE